MAWGAHYKIEKTPKSYHEQTRGNRRGVTTEAPRNRTVPRKHQDSPYTWRGKSKLATRQWIKGRLRKAKSPTNQGGIVTKTLAERTNVECRVKTMRVNYAVFLQYVGCVKREKINTTRGKEGHKVRWQKGPFGASGEWCGPGEGGEVCRRNSPLC